MALIPEDGTGLVDADSYISVAYADDYHSSFGNSQWALLTTGQKEIAIRKATEHLDFTYQWKGVLFSENQSLGWPRSSAYDKEGRDISEMVPELVKKATAELALKASSGSLVSDVSGGLAVKKRKVDAIETEYFEGAKVQIQYTHINRMLSGLITGMAGGIFVDLVRV